MRKIILKTAFITLGVVIVLAVAAFGVASLCVPAAMSDLAYSLGMEAISSDYAYQEYERSGDLAYLARSFELAATHGRDEQAEERFDILYASDGFADLCAQRDAQIPPVVVEGEQITYSYRDYVCGLEACVMYRLARMRNPVPRRSTLRCPRRTPRFRREIPSMCWRQRRREMRTGHFALKFTGTRRGGLCARRVLSDSRKYSGGICR